MRRLIAFPCDSETLIGTLDQAEGSLGLLIVSGGNELRIGAHRGMALLSKRLVDRGISVFRFDRRGIGDSTGDNRGWSSSESDIVAAAAAFRAAVPHLSRLAGFGNCDAATALALFAAPAGVDPLILANPWLADDDDGLPPAAAIRARYVDRVRDPRQWLRLVTGGVDFAKLIGGLRKLLHTSPDTQRGWAERFFAAVPDTAAVVLASGDATAQGFADAARRRGWRGSLRTIDTASHSFARRADADALFEAIVAALA